MDTTPASLPSALRAVPGVAAPPRRDRLDPPGPDQSTEAPLPEPSSPEPPTRPGLLSRLTGPSTSDGQSSGATGTSTEPRWKPGGDPDKVGETIAGVIMLVCGLVAIAARRRSRTFRMPTPKERDAIAMPIGRIAVRHLPMQLVGDDLLDSIAAARATETYITAAPLFARAPAPTLDLPERETA